MNLEEAKAYLNTTERWECRDHAFGDVEVSWTIGDAEVASGYFGGGNYEVSIYGQHTARFIGEDAKALRKTGKLVQVDRNDETGPDEFVEGAIMPGLTLEAVRKELTGEM